MKPITNRKKLIIIYLYCLALIMGSAYNMYVHYDFSHSGDTKSYLKIAKGDMNVSITHRYRVIIPYTAAIVAAPIQLIYKSLWPHRAETDWPLQLAFYLINSALMALAGLIIFLICEAFGATIIASLIAVTAVLMSRWTVYLAGLPMTDSLYIVIVALMLYAIQTKSSRLLLLCIFIGPFAKESFVFFVPLILYFGRDTLSIPKQLMAFVVSGILVFSVRYIIDWYTGVEAVQSIQNAVNHFDRISYTFYRLFAFRGIGELFGTYGLFTIPVLIGLFYNKSRERMRDIKWMGISFMLIILVHVFLSGEASRMLFYSCPLVAILLAVTIDSHPLFNWITNTVNSINNLAKKVASSQH